MTHYEDSNFVTYDPKKKVVRKSFEIHASKVARANCKRLWRVGSFLKEGPQFLVEVISELRSCYIIVVIHDAGDV